MSTNQVVPRSVSMAVDQPQQIGQMTGMLSQMIVSQGLSTRSALDAVNAANEQKIEALKAQVAAMEKTLAVSQRALAESQMRVAEKPRISAAKREAEIREIESIQSEATQYKRRFEQFNPALTKLAEERERDLLILKTFVAFGERLKDQHCVVS